MRQSNFKVIILSGRKQSGKDTAAYRLVNDHGFVRTAFADFLKEISMTILNRIDCPTTHDNFELEEKKNEFVTDVNGKRFEFITEERNGVPMTYRQFLQQLGTEALRRNIHEHIWIIPVLKFIRDTATDPKTRYNGVVISDARFPNEIDEVKKFCRMYMPNVEVLDVNVVRPSQQKSDRHASEISLDDYEFTVGILNDGSIEDLFVKVDKLATGEWKMDMMQADIKRRSESGWMAKYSQ